MCIRDRVTDIEEISGHGVKADIGGKKVLAGNLKLRNKYNIDSSAGKDSIENARGTLVYVAIGCIYAGCIVISDVIKPTSQQAIAALKKAGVKKVIIDVYKRQVLYYKLGAFAAVGT